MNNEQTQLTHWKKLTNPNYLGSYSLQPNEERIITIKKVVREQIKGMDGKTEECTIAYLENEKPFILNATNCKTLTKVFDTPFIENWKGRQCIVYSARVKAFGEMIDALRVKAVKPPLPILNENDAKWNGAVEALKSKRVNMQWIKERYQLTKESELLLIELTKTTENDK